MGTSAQQLDPISAQLLQEWESAGMSAKSVAKYEERARKSKYDWRELLNMRKIDEVAEFNIPADENGDPQLDALVFGTPTEIKMDVLPRIVALLSRFAFDEQAPYGVRMKAMETILGTVAKQPQAPTTVINQTNILEVSDEQLLKIAMKRGSLGASH